MRCQKYTVRFQKTSLFDIMCRTAVDQDPCSRTVRNPLISFLLLRPSMQFYSAINSRNGITLQWLCTAAKGRVSALTGTDSKLTVLTKQKNRSLHSFLVTNGNYHNPTHLFNRPMSGIWISSLTSSKSPSQILRVACTSWMGFKSIASTRKMEVRE